MTNLSVFHVDKVHQHIVAQSFLQGYSIRPSVAEDACHHITPCLKPRISNVIKSDYSQQR